MPKWLNTSLRVAFYFYVAIITLWFVSDQYFVQMPEQEQKRRCKSVRIGMTRDDVRKFIGTPECVSFILSPEGKQVEQWHYVKMSGVASSAMQCEFDSVSGVVIKIQCGD